MDKIEIRERVIETNYYLTQAMLNDNKEEVQRLRVKLNNLIKKYIQL